MVGEVVMKTIRERAREYATRDKSSEYNFFEISGVNEYKRIYNEEFYAYKRGATEQKAIDIETACKACENELRRLRRILDDSVGVPANLMLVEESLSRIRNEMISSIE